MARIERNWRPGKMLMKGRRLRLVTERKLRIGRRMRTERKLRTGWWLMAGGSWGGDI
jgi:hypothetical protein